MKKNRYPLLLFDQALKKIALFVCFCCISLVRVLKQRQNQNASLYISTTSPLGILR